MHEKRAGLQLKELDTFKDTTSNIIIFAYSTI